MARAIRQDTVSMSNESVKAIDLRREIRAEGPDRRFGHGRRTEVAPKAVFEFLALEDFETAFELSPQSPWIPSVEVLSHGFESDFLGNGEGISKVGFPSAVEFHGH